MTTTDTEAAPPTTERETCLFPGCTNPAAPGPKPAANGRTGPPPRYCELEEHHASSAFQELKRIEAEKADTA